MINKEISNIIKESIQLKELVLKDEALLNDIENVIQLILKTLKNNQQLFICGNGGSAADALHIAAEFSGRFYLNRRALPVEALNVNMAAITAISNDYGFDYVYARMLESKAREGDLLWLLSTSGKSPNIIEVAKKAQELNVATIAFTGQNITELDNLVQQMIKIPSIDTPRIQECHLMIGHIICELVEKQLFNE